MIKTRIFQENKNTFWAFEENHQKPLPDSIDTNNYADLLKTTYAGIGHTALLATKRLEKQLENPRESSKRIYENSFIDLESSLGTLAVVAYSPKNSNQPHEWLVEAFVGNDIKPTEIKTLPMYYPTNFGIDCEDWDNLFSHTDTWWPPKSSFIPQDIAV